MAMVICSSGCSYSIGFTSRRASPNTLGLLRECQPCRSAFYGRTQRTSVKVFAAKRRSRKQPEPDKGFSVDTLNPIQLGREARKVFDDVWGEITKLASPTRSFTIDEFLESEQTPPQSSFTTVLVVGATGRVGRVVVRKLLLRGYKVRAMVRKREASLEERLQGLPAKIEFVEGDVGNPESCQEALKGVDKDETYRRAKKRGLRSSSRSKREVADFKREYHQNRWDVEAVGVPGLSPVQQMSKARAAINDDSNLEFTGVLVGKSAVAEVGADVEELLPGGDYRIRDMEVLTLRVKGDGNTYACVLRTATGLRYSARFAARLGYSHVRLPFVSFRPERPEQPPLDLGQVKHMSIRAEHKKAATSGQRRAALEEAGLVLRRAPGLADDDDGPTGSMAAPRQLAAAQPAGFTPDLRTTFKLEVDWIKALPSGMEPEFILVSAAGQLVPQQELDTTDLRRLLAAKARGEDNLRLSGLGYTIVRPARLVDEPGGYKALVFDQGNRVDTGVSYADVADICVRALHDPEARNKTFEVCYEAQSEETDSKYELVGQVPDPRSNYLGPALASLQKNT